MSSGIIEELMFRRLILGMRNRKRKNKRQDTTTGKSRCRRAIPMNVVSVFSNESLW